MKNEKRPTNEQLLEQDRQAAIDDAVSDCASLARLIANELSRETWNRPDREVETLQFLSKKLSEQVEELQVCTSY